MADKTFERVSRIATKYSDHLDSEDLSDEVVEQEKNEIEGLGFQPMEEGESLGRIASIMVQSLEAFKEFVPRGIVIGKVNEGENAFETRFFLPRQFQLDHSVAIKAGVRAASDIVKAICPKAKISTLYQVKSIKMKFRGL